MKIRREERKDGGGKDEVTVKCFSHKEKSAHAHPVITGLLCRGWDRSLIIYVLF